VSLVQIIKAVESVLNTLTNVIHFTYKTVEAMYLLLSVVADYFIVSFHFD